MVSKELASLRKHVDNLLRMEGAHLSFDEAVAGFPPALRGARPAGAPHSAWELLEHMRIAQNDILLFSKSAKHVSPQWPEGYWPPAEAPKRKSQWGESVKAFRADLAAFERLLFNPRKDLYEPFPWGEGQTLLREALLIADHNAYHLGQLVLVRRLLSVWG